MLAKRRFDLYVTQGEPDGTINAQHQVIAYFHKRSEGHIVIRNLFTSNRGGSHGGDS